MNIKKMFRRTRNVIHGQNHETQTIMGESDGNDSKRKRKHEVGSISMRQTMDVIRLIHERKWDRLRKLLRSRNGKNLCSVTESSKLNILGMALSARPPADIIALILSLNPALVHQRDENGAIPLHVGCLNGISMENLNQIIRAGGNKIARARDSGDRTVLHHAVEYNCMMSITSSIHSSLISIMYEESIEVIEHLLSVVPETVHHSSVNGETPLDIPHLFKMRGYEDQYIFRLEEVYRLLRATSIEQYKSRKKLWEDIGYKNTESTTKSLPSVVSSSLGGETNCSTGTCSRIDLYHELDKMSINSSEPKER